MARQQQKSTDPSQLQRLEVRDRDRHRGRFGVRQGLLSGSFILRSCRPGRGEGVPRAPFVRALIPFTRTHCHNLATPLSSHLQMPSLVG